jgi:hypothetical protein
MYPAFFILLLCFIRLIPLPKQIQGAFLQQSSITLFDFLRPEVYELVLKTMTGHLTPAGKITIPTNGRATDYLDEVRKHTLLILRVRKREDCFEGCLDFIKM